MLGLTRPADRGKPPGWGIVRLACSPISSPRPERWTSSTFASYQRLWSPTATPGLWTFTGSEENVDGTLSVEISSGDNGNGWVKVRTLGTVGGMSP